MVWCAKYGVPNMVYQVWCAKYGVPSMVCQISPGKNGGEPFVAHLANLNTCTAVVKIVIALP